MGRGWEGVAGHGAALREGRDKAGAGTCRLRGALQPPRLDACAGGTPQPWSCDLRGDQGTGTRLCLLGSTPLIIGTDFLEHQLWPI